MTPRQAIAFVRKHGIVLEAAAGPVPSLAEAIAGEPIRGSWVPAEVSAEAARLSEGDALLDLGGWVS